jgi:predicted RNase H-like HicB family nuclease
MGYHLAMRRTYPVIVERDEDGFFVGSVPGLRGCHSQAKSLDVLMRRMDEAIHVCLEANHRTRVRTEFVGVQQITVDS